MSQDLDYPEGWTTDQLERLFDINPKRPSADVLDAKARVSFVPMDAVDARLGEITRRDERSFGEVRQGYTAFADGDVILAKITPCFENGKVAVASGLTNGLGFGSSEFHVFRSQGAIVPQYLFHFLRQQAFRDKATHYMTGTAGQLRVPADYVKGVVLPIAPFAEQHRIVQKVEELLDRVRAARDHLAKVPAILRRFRYSVLAAAFSGRLTENMRGGGAASLEKYIHEIEERRWRAATKANRRRYQPALKLEEDSSRIPEIPSSWTWLTADALCSQITDGEHIQPRYQSSGRPMLTAKHVRDGFVDFRDYGVISEEDFARCLTRCAPRENDILIVSVGATTGRAAIVRNRPPFAIVRSVLLLRPLIKPEFFLYWCQTLFAFRWMTEASGASAQPHLYISDVRRMPVPLTSPEEQSEIVGRVEALFSLSAAIEHRLRSSTASAKDLTQAILANAFAGELATTEAELARAEGRSYETAEMLLERIRRENGARIQDDMQARVVRARSSRRPGRKIP